MNRDFFDLFLEYDFSGISNEGKCKSFKKWLDLPPEIGQMIIQNMNIVTRSRFASSSKTNYSFEMALRFPIFALGVIEGFGGIPNYFDEEKRHFVKLEIDFDESRENFIKLKFVKEGDDCFLYRRSRRKYWKIIGATKNMDYKEAAQNYVQMILQKTKYQIKEINVETTSFRLKSILFACFKNIERFKISSENLDSLLWYIEKMGRKMIYLEISAKDCNGMELFLPPDFIDIIMPQLVNCEKISFIALPGFDDEQFFKLKAKEIEMRMDSRSMISIKTLNEFLKKWIKGELRDDFVQLFTWIGYRFDIDELLEGINVTKWDDGFKSKNYLFVEEFEDNTLMYETEDDFEVKNENETKAATLRISHNIFSFCVTGFQFNGKLVHRIPWKSRPPFFRPLPISENY
ncbi:unnamed protein product [Caenorhabditis angaria]|uniref:F-box associated domain-containing protein n=1 Tax=Caenorhabditis angaria TaxID=860376 RepID=A0A9P1IY64_9PELO|nr:unnamed protein product [Caenorhabditis angaria]